MPLTTEIDAIVAQAIEQRIFPGAVVLIAKCGAIRHYTAYGNTMYDTPGSQAVTRDTIYDVASLTKMFTATAALRLFDLGLLDLHAPAASYLPEIRTLNITVQQLLTHTSGLDIRLSALRHCGRDGLLATVYAAEPLKAPGTTVAYTNVNSLLLGEIVARLYGAPFDIALRELVLAPLGLRDTQFRPSPLLLPRIAPTEIDEDWRGGLVWGTVHDESAHALGGIAGHAGLFSTAAELYTFCQVWLDESTVAAFRHEGRQRLLREATITLARTNHTPELQLACGLGWMIDRPNFMGNAPQGSFGHTGFTGPALVIVPQQQLIVVVVNNRVYPRRGPARHHAIIAAIVEATLRMA